MSPVQPFYGLHKEAFKETLLQMIQQEPDVKNSMRKIVKEEFRNLLTGLERNSENQVQTSEPRCLNLQFLNNVLPLILTGEEIKGEGDSSIRVALIDQSNDQVVDSGPEASAKVEIVALNRNVGGAEQDTWTSEDFNKSIVQEREDLHTKEKNQTERKREHPLLGGHLFLHLNKGIGFVGNIRFRQYSSWMKNQEFKLGARALDTFGGIRIKEAVTEPFMVKDRRRSYRKHPPLSLADDVSKLKNFCKCSDLCKRLQEQKVNTIKDFLIQLFKDPEGLKHIVGLEEKLWHVTLNHAQSMIGKRMCYYPCSQQNFGVVFNVVEQVLGVIWRFQYFPINELSNEDKAVASNLAIAAFEHWEDVVLYHDMNTLLQYASGSSTSRDPSNSTRLDCPSFYDTEASGIIVEHNNTESDISFQGNFSYADSSRDLNNAENFGSCCVNNVEVTEEPSSSSGHDADSIEFWIECAEKFSRREMARKRWEVLSIVLRMKKVLRLKKMHQHKKARFY